MFNRTLKIGRLEIMVGNILKTLAVTVAILPFYIGYHGLKSDCELYIAWNRVTQQANSPEGLKKRAEELAKRFKEIGITFTLEGTDIEIQPTFKVESLPTYDIPSFCNSIATEKGIESVYGRELPPKHLLEY